MCKKNDKSGVYEINGRVIDIFGLTDEEFDQARKTMTREDFIEYAVDVNMAFRRAWEDGIVDECGEMGDFSDEELKNIFRDMVVEEYDGYMSTSDKAAGVRSDGFLARDPGADRERWLLEMDRRRNICIEAKSIDS